MNLRRQKEGGGGHRRGPSEWPGREALQASHPAGALVNCRVSPAADATREGRGSAPDWAVGTQADSSQTTCLSPGRAGQSSGGLLLHLSPQRQDSELRTRLARAGLCPAAAQARILEWIAISFSRGSSRPRDPIQVSWIARWVLYH